MNKLQATGVALISAVALATATAHAGETSKARVISKAAFRVTAPAGWDDLPQIAEASQTQAAKAAGPTATVVAVAFGSFAKKRFGIALEVAAPFPTGSVRANLVDYHAGTKKQLESGGGKITTWVVDETATTMSAHFTGELSGLALIGESVGFADKKHVLHGTAMTCLYQPGDADGERDCKSVVKTFAITMAAKDLQKLEAK